MNEIVAQTGTEQMVSTLIGIAFIFGSMIVILIYRKLQKFEWFCKFINKIGLESEFAKELLTDIKNESTSVAKKQGIRKVREENITVLDDVNMETIAKYEGKAQAASDKKLGKDQDGTNNSSDREDSGGEVQTPAGGSNP